MFKLRGVTKIYQSRTVLGPLDLHIRRCETTILLGPSGCGKSTLLRLLLGLIQPDTGELVAFGHDPKLTYNWPLIRQRIGYVIQDGGLFPHMTVRKNVSLMASHLRWDERKIQQRIETLTQLARLPKDVLSRFPEQLSGGQKQRVALMRALMLEPEILLLDEPFGALDPMIRSELQQDLRSMIRDLNLSVVIVTHDLNEACFLADRVILLNEGKIIQDGTPRELYDQPEDSFVTKFVQAQRPVLLETPL